MTNLLLNKYYRIYLALCNRGKNRIVEGYTEKHHILPKSLGGLNTIENLVRLTAREHFIAHACLVRCTTETAHIKMVCALHFLKWGSNKKVNSERGKVVNARIYEINKQQKAAYTKISFTKMRSNAEFQRRMVSSVAAYWSVPEHDKRRSETSSQTAKLMWENPEYREKYTNIAKQRGASDAFRSSQRDITLKRMQDPEVRERFLDGMTQRYKTPAWRERLSAAAKKNWQDPTYRIKMTAIRRNRLSQTS